MNKSLIFVLILSVIILGVASMRPEHWPWNGNEERMENLFHAIIARTHSVLLMISLRFHFQINVRSNCVWCCTLHIMNNMCWVLAIFHQSFNENQNKNIIFNIYQAVCAKLVVKEVDIAIVHLIEDRAVLTVATEGNLYF